MGLLTRELRALVGSERRYEAPEPIGAAAGRYFALAIGDDNPLYRDRAQAMACGLIDIALPLTLICETNQYADRPMDAEGYAGHTWGIEIPGTRTVRGGNSYEFFRRVRPDDRITAVWRLVAIEEKATKGGTQMVVVTSRASYSDQRGELLATNDETVIFVALEDAR